MHGTQDAAIPVEVSKKLYKEVCVKVTAVVFANVDVILIIPILQAASTDKTIKILEGEMHNFLMGYKYKVVLVITTLCQLFNNTSHLICPYFSLKGKHASDGGLGQEKDTISVKVFVITKEIM